MTSDLFSQEKMMSIMATMDTETKQFLWGRSMAVVAMENVRQQPPRTKRPCDTEGQSVGKRGNGVNRRKRRRFHINSAAQVIRLVGSVEPEIAPLVDASSEGILFTTDRDYPVGTPVLVKFPYPRSTSPKQKGAVVRVDVLRDGRRRVAIALGEEH